MELLLNKYLFDMNLIIYGDYNLPHVLVLDNIDKTVLKMFTQPHTFPIWFSSELCLLIKEKNNVYKLFK